MTLIERRNGMEYFRDQAAEHFARYTGSHWHPRSGSMVNHRALTSAVIDSRDFLAAKRRAETEVLLPAGPKIAFTGGLDFNDHRLIWDKLDQVNHGNRGAKRPQTFVGGSCGPQRGRGHVGDSFRSSQGRSRSGSAAAGELRSPSSCGRTRGAL